MVAVMTDGESRDGMKMNVFYGKRRQVNHQVEEHKKENIAAFVHHGYFRFYCKYNPGGDSKTGIRCKIHIPRRSQDVFVLTFLRISSR